MNKMSEKYLFVACLFEFVNFLTWHIDIHNDLSHSLVKSHFKKLYKLYTPDGCFNALNNAESLTYVYKCLISTKPVHQIVHQYILKHLSLTVPK